MAQDTIQRFLPDDFDATKPMVVIAGKGLYPQLTCARARAAGCPVRLVAFEDETAEELWDSFADGERERIKVGQLGHLLKALKRFDAANAIMAGQITPRKLFKGLHPDLKAIQILATLKERNAESIFGAIAREMEKMGVRLLDARVFLEDQLADAGLMSRGRYVPDADTLAHGVRVAKALADLDVGQGIVVNNGTVLAAEAFEGTDKMLERGGSFDADHPLFVKTVKPRQDYRFDVPVFGLRTIEKMDAAGIAAAALEAKNVLMLEKEKVLEAARAKKITLLGY